ncbi:hypothetical protein IFM89_035651 [Coptis chinensis]|uniref:Uncharacterized protein n=1 Tax=Coptis chinensis TaxID=261450 RepID=A0A835HIZ7_9MAGN|nr:hypothetical protein IFM89_035651 [Coptis chinensis]
MSPVSKPTVHLGPGVDFLLTRFVTIFGLGGDETLLIRNFKDDDSEEEETSFFHWALDTTVDGLVEEFEVGYKFETGDYSRKLIEFCSSKALTRVCCYVEENINDGSFSRFTFDMMLAWERPRSGDEKSSSYTVCTSFSYEV